MKVENEIKIIAILTELNKLVQIISDEFVKMRNDEMQVYENKPVLNLNTGFIEFKGKFYSKKKISELKIQDEFYFVKYGVMKKNKIYNIDGNKNYFCGNMSSKDKLILGDKTIVLIQHEAKK